MLKYILVAEIGQVRVSTIKVKLYQILDILRIVCNPHFFKHIYLRMICKTMSTYTFRNRRERGRR